MFDKAKYVTSGVDLVVPPLLQYFMWNAIETMKVPDKDYLQIFKLSSNSTLENPAGRENVSSNPASDGSAIIESIGTQSGQSIQHIIHSQEQPTYSMTYSLVGISEPIDTKIYVIDDNTHSTMLLAEEY